MMITYTVAQLHSFYGDGTQRTFERYISKLKKEGKFTKSKLRRCYTEKEAQRLAELLEFTIPTKTTPPKPSQQFKVNFT